MSDTTQLEKVRAEMVRRHENDLERAAQRIAELQAQLAQRINTRCPSCGNQTLFIGEGGHLTCSFLGCKQPSVARKVFELEKELADEKQWRIVWERQAGNAQELYINLRVALQVLRSRLVEIPTTRASTIEIIDHALQDKANGGD